MPGVVNGTFMDSLEGSCNYIKMVGNENMTFDKVIIKDLNAFLFYFLEYDYIFKKIFLKC